MRTQSRDTHPDIERMLIEHYRTMTPAQKLAAARDLHQAALELAGAGVRLRHPDAPDDEVRLRALSRWLTPGDMRVHFGWDVTEKGY